VFAEEAKKQSTHHVFSGDCQFFFTVGVSNAEVHIGEFADFSQAFRLREASIILSTETGSSVSVRCSGSFAFGGVWLALFRSHAEGDFSSKRRPSFRPILFNCVTPASQRDPAFCK
jgi:hypothetical protein